MQANLKMQQEMSPLDTELERQLEELRTIIRVRKAQSRKLWEGRTGEASSGEEEEEKKKVVGKFTLYVTKYDW